MHQGSLFIEDEIIILTDKDGDKIVFNRYADRVSAIRAFLKCSKKEAEKTLEELSREYEVYSCKDYQIVLAKGDKVIYNFEIAGETWYNGHKYNELNEWAFRALCDGIKPKEKKPPKLKKIVVMSTERQVKKAKQLYYANNIGFSITAKDYQRWHLL